MENWKDQELRAQVKQNKEKNSGRAIPDINLAVSISDRLQTATRMAQETNFPFELFLDNMENEISLTFTGHGKLGLCVLLPQQNGNFLFVKRTGMPPFDFDVDLLEAWLRETHFLRH